MSLVIFGVLIATSIITPPCDFIEPTKRRKTIFCESSAYLTKNHLTANIFESGPMPTP